MEENKYLSKDTLHKITEVFGEDFYGKPVCDKVCAFVKGMFPEAQDLTKFIGVLVRPDSDIAVLVRNGHHVIRSGDSLYDYTAEQYSNLGIDREGRVHVLKQIADRVFAEEQKDGSLYVITLGK